MSGCVSRSVSESVVDSSGSELFCEWLSELEIETETLIETKWVSEWLSELEFETDTEIET